MQIFENFRGSMSPVPLELFLLLKLPKINSAGKKLRLKKWRNLVPFPEKDFEYPPDTKHFQRAYVRPFSNLNILVFS